MPILKGTENTLFCPRSIYSQRISIRAKSVSSEDPGTFFAFTFRGRYCARAEVRCFTQAQSFMSCALVIKVRLPAILREELNHRWTSE